MTMIVAFLCHLGFANGLLEHEVNHAFIQLLHIFCLSKFWIQKNAQQMHYMKYVLLFNPKKVTDYLFRNMPQH